MKSAFFPGFSKGFCIFFAYFKLFVLKTLEFLPVRGKKSSEKLELLKNFVFQHNSSCDKNLSSY